jgi:hypothetical protein
MVYSRLIYYIIIGIIIIIPQNKLEGVLKYKVCSKSVQLKYIYSFYFGLFYLRTMKSERETTKMKQTTYKHSVQIKFILYKK